MSHDAWASFASVELARDCLSVSTNWFDAGAPSQYQSYATRDPSPGWPLADGAIEIDEIPKGYNALAAVEFKRINEGRHGILTGIGQVQAYLSKGFSASVLVLPSQYDAVERLDAPGEYAAAVLNTHSPASPIGVFVYDDPDLTSTSPFLGRLRCIRPVRIDTSVQARTGVSMAGSGRQRTQWAHMREGSTYPDALYRYLQAALDVQAGQPPFNPTIRQELITGALANNAKATPSHYLSFTSASKAKKPLADEAWRRFWFGRILTVGVQSPWSRAGGTYAVERASTELVTWDGDPSVFFARADGIKQKIVTALNAGKLSQASAWQSFAENIHKRAHQFREDLDSSLEAAGFLSADGEPTQLGFHFVTECNRSRSANAPKPLAILRWAFLTKGGMLAFLHYVHSISDLLFRAAPLQFVQFRKRRSKSSKAVCTSSFDSTSYRDHLATELTDNLHVAARSALRGGRKRPPLEAEFITLRHLGLVRRFRAGVGLEINWPAVHDALDLDLG